MDKENKTMTWIMARPYT